MSDNDKPSAFVDSPEDLLLRAKYLIAGGSLSPQATLLMSDLARELRKSREGHASRVNMVVAANDERQAVESERDVLRTTNKRLGEEVTRLRSEYRRANLIGGCLGLAALLAIVFDVILVNR